MTDKKLRDWLIENNLLICPGCGKEIDRGDMEWFGGNNEVGKEYSIVEIQCSACHIEIAEWLSWWWGIESFDDLMEKVLDDYESDL